MLISDLTYVRILNVIESYEKLYQNLESEIIISKVQKTDIAKKMGMSYKTFYRKLKNEKFTEDEVVQVFECIRLLKERTE